MKYCPTCKTEKETASFYTNKSKKDGLHSECKECSKKRKQGWSSSNKEKVAAYDKEWQKSNKDKKSKNYRNWQKNNKAFVNTYNSSVRASKLKRTPAWLTPHDYKVMESKYAMAAWLSAIVGIDYHVDHTIPLRGKNVSGLHVPDNLRIIPAKDNLEKGNKYG